MCIRHGPKYPSVISQTAKTLKLDQESNYGNQFLKKSDEEQKEKQHKRSNKELASLKQVFEYT